MSIEMFTNHILDNKRDTYDEFMTTLFEKCNIACGFCWQDHDNMVGVDSVRDKVDVLLNAAKQSTYDHVVFNLMGGELFADDIFTDKMYNDYEYLIKTVFEKGQDIGKKISFTFVTNLIFSSPERVRQLVHDLNHAGIEIALTTSYDFSGRFNSSTLEIFKNNVSFFGDDLMNISIVLTAPNIRELLKDNDETFKWLYEKGFRLFFDYYSPEDHAEVMAPSDSLLLEAFTFLIDNYPNTSPVSEWITQHHNKMTCKSSKVVFPDGSISQCGSLPEQQIVHFFKSPEELDNTSMETSFITKRNCVTCEYFSRCGLGCYLLHYFEGREQLDECIFKLTFDKITNK